MEKIDSYLKTKIFIESGTQYTLTGNAIVNYNNSCITLIQGTNLPSNWPCSWNDGVVPFVFNYYSLNPKRLISLVLKGHAYIEQRSCLKFVEHNPVELLNKLNFTFLFYTYSGVLESCCLPFYSKPTGRRLILITPVCTLPTEVAHVTLHALGLEHRRYEAFPEAKSRAVLFPITCLDFEKKLAAFESKQEEDII